MATTPRARARRRGHAAAARAALCSGATVSVLAAATLAQAPAIVPAVLAATEGGSGSSLPFGTNQPVRFQCIYDVGELGFRGPRVIQGISLRADNSDPGTTTFAAKGWLVVSVRMSTTHVSPETASAEFNENWGTDMMPVLVNTPIQLPAQPPQPGVRAANIDLPFTTPWVYGLTPTRFGEPAPENLLIEILVHSQPTGAYRIDNVGSCQSPSTTFGGVGPACAPAGGQNLVVVPGPSLQTGSSFTWRIENAPPNSGVFLWVATANTGNFLGLPSLPLPVPLFDPQDPTRAFPALQALSPALAWPAPDCWIHVDPAAILFAPADATGVASVSAGLAPGRRFLGATLFVQAMAFAQTANPLQVVTSGGQRTSVCGPLGVARLYALGSTTAQSGQLGVGQGAVIELR